MFSYTNIIWSDGEHYASKSSIFTLRHLHQSISKSGRAGSSGADCSRLFSFVSSPSSPESDVWSNCATSSRSTSSPASSLHLILAKRPRKVWIVKLDYFRIYMWHPNMPLYVGYISLSFLFSHQESNKIPFRKLLHTLQNLKSPFVDKCLNFASPLRGWAVNHGIVLRVYPIRNESKYYFPFNPV